MIALGEYVISYAKTKNDMTLKGVPEIALRTSKNQRGHYFMSLLTGKRITTYHWEELTINEKVIMTFES